MKFNRFPDELEDLAASLTVGQMIPIPENGNSPNITFLIRETDQVVGETLSDPMIELRVGHLQFENQKQFQIMYILCRLAGGSSVYEVPFCYVTPEYDIYLCAIEGKSTIQLLFSGDLQNSVVNLNIPQFHITLDSVIEILKKGARPDWSKDDFFARIADVNRFSKTTGRLWEIFDENDNFVSVLL